MRDERYEPSSVSDKNQIRDLRMALENTRDFIMWLFDESDHLDHTTYSEVWEEFEKHEERLNTDQNVQVSDTTDSSNEDGKQKN